MAPRTRRLAAQERKDKMPKSLRSFFAMEIVDEILSHLDQSSLAALCRASYDSLKEAGPVLLRHVDIEDWAGFRSFFLQPSLPAASRLHSHLHPTHMRTLAVRISYHGVPKTAVAELRVDKAKGRVFPAALPLLRLSLTTPIGKATDAYYTRILSLFDPVHLELLAGRDRESSRSAMGVAGTLPPSVSLGWTSLRRVSLVGWCPTGVGDKPTESFLARLPPSEHTFELEIDLRGWFGGTLELRARTLSINGWLRMERLNAVRWFVDKPQALEVEEKLAEMADEERDKVELVAV